MDLALLFQVLLAVQITWQPVPEAQKYLLFRAPVVTTFTVNEDGISIPNDACGQWRGLGNTVGLSAIDKNGLTSGSWCYGVKSVHIEGGVDADTGLPIAPITSISEMSDVVVVTIP